MSKKVSTNNYVHTAKGTSQGRRPIMSSMNKDKRRSFKKYRGQGK